METDNQKWVLLTGASGDIGNAIALQLAEMKFNLILQYHSNLQAINRLICLIKQKNNCQIITLACDFSKLDAVKTIFDTISNNNIKLHAVIHNAGGIYGHKQFADIREDDWDKTLALNAKTPLFLTKKLLKYINKNGHIIFISSISAKYGGGKISFHYGCAKAALECGALGISRLLAEKPVYVNVIRLGFIETQIHTKMKRTKQDIKKRIQKIPLKIAGQPNDVSQAVFYLLKSKFTTGSILELTGGD